MAAAQIKIISRPEEQEARNEEQFPVQENKAEDKQQVFLDQARQGDIASQAKNRLMSCISEIRVLRSQNNWEQILTMFYPLEEKEPEVVQAGLDARIRQDIAFALGQKGQYDLAVEEYAKALKKEPDNFWSHSGLAYTLYNTLFAAKNKEILLTPEAKKQRIEKAHVHFNKAQELAPGRVTNFYREGMLFKSLQNKPELAMPLFESAVKNWKSYSDEEKEARHQEKKNYIKSLYNLASCQLQKNLTKQALEALNECMHEDQTSNHVRPEFKYFAQGKILYFQGKYEQSLKSLELSETHADPGHSDFIHELMGRNYLQLKQYEKGLECIAKIPKKKRRAYVRWTEADLLCGLGELDQAKQILSLSAEKDRRSMHKSLIRLARIAYSQKKYEQVADYARQADEFHIDTFNTPDQEGLFWQAAALYHLGQLEKAREKMQALEEFKPDHPYLPELRKVLA